MSQRLEKSLLISILLVFCTHGKPLLAEEIVVGVSIHDVKFQLGSRSSFSIRLRGTTSIPLTVNFTYDNQDILEPIPSREIWNGTSMDFILRSLNVGKVTLVAHVYGVDHIKYDNAFVRVSVLHYPVLDKISIVIGWMYFVAWSVSFYPQTYSNFKRKSVVGFSFDFLGLNITGFLFYSVFNVAMYFSPTVKDEYLLKNPNSIIPVELNDVVFVLHATFATVVQIAQCLIYERGNQRVSLITQAFIVAFWLTGFVFLIVTSAGGSHSYPWLTFVYYFSYVKLAISLLKYTPQAYYNFKRKSTEGWSIGNILLDFTGGFLSLLQMFIIAYNINDWISLFGNLTKFGLGVFSILFDVLFIVQHYCLYRPTSEKKNK